MDNVGDVGGGGNMVKVIVVEFGGLDTLFEIGVLGVGGMGI